MGGKIQQSNFRTRLGSDEGVHGIWASTRKYEGIHDTTPDEYGENETKMASYTDECGEGEMNTASDTDEYGCCDCRVRVRGEG